MKNLRYLFVAMISLILISVSGCGEKDKFVITGKIEGADAQSVTLTYYANGGLKSLTTKMNNGVFQFTGQSKRPTLALLTVAPENQRLAAAVVVNGDELTIEAKLGDPYATKIIGNDDSESLQRWITKNADLLKSGNAARINAAIAEYVKENTDKLSAPALMVTCFRSKGFETLADSLFSVLKQEVRTQEMTQNFNAVISSYVGSSASEAVPFLNLYGSNDSLINVNPLRHSATLLCFLDSERGQRDSVVKVLRELADKYDRKRLAPIELSTAIDSATWRRSINGDSARWIQTWLPGSVASAPVRKMDITRIPFFIVADSAGKQIYRGPSISEARKKVENHLDR